MLTFTLHLHKLSNWQWLSANRDRIWHMFQSHVYLSLGSVVIGFIIAVPLGVLAARVPRVYGPLLAVTTTLYALPSLAFFAFLISFTNLSDTTVLIPLVAYSLAILVRGVTDGLNNVPDEVRIAATAMGYQPFRRLVAVELPAAVPVVVGSLRVATVSSISLLTVASLIGHGGLGQLITEGEYIGYMFEVVVGIVAVTILALVCDGALLLGGRLATPWTRRTT